jgi:2-polyprenyl-3-methyl-5-hydroxy-6-metoxy-1,4-benzoquinol methylase
VKRTQQIRDFFNTPQIYLEKPFGIKMRSLVSRELLGEITNANILDAGCGDGSVSLGFLENTNRLTLLDVAENMLDLARKNTPLEFLENVTYVRQDLIEFSPERTFDVIICLGVLAHVQSVDDVIKKITSLLSPGGRCLLQFSAYNHPVTRMHQLVGKVRESFYSYSVNPATYEQIYFLCKNENLELLDQRSYLGLFPGMGRLPDSWLFQYSLLSLRCHWLSRFGSEYILLLQKIQ